MARKRKKKFEPTNLDNLLLDYGKTFIFHPERLEKNNTDPKPKKKRTRTKKTKS